jgi:iron complex outermembrane recepter protein
LHRFSYWLGLALITAAGWPRTAAPADEPLQEVLVTAAYLGGGADDAPQSITVLDAATLQGAGVQHLEDVLALVPDLNWAAGTNRPRFFQLRGIGEVEQYQGAPNPSVGFLIDDIDFSGVGSPATLFDVGSVEVLRGPQGTSYGANALAGLISVHTQDPGDHFELRSEVSGADYGTGSAGIAVGDGWGSMAGGWRLVAQQYRSDGFRQDVYLGRDSTNGYDEGTLRAKFAWQLTPALHADLTLMYVNIDDGYDAWSLNNTYTTWSNQPGRDAQLSRGAALRLVDNLDGLGELRSVTSTADSAIVYSYDGDWGNDSYWGVYAPYDYFQSDQRSRRTVAEDLRFTADPSRALWGRVHWLVGAYALRLTEDDLITNVYDDQYNGAGITRLSSQYAATNVALYSALDASIGARGSLSGGIRVEHRDATYADSASTALPAAINGMVGGNLSYTLKSSEQQREYLTLARGYKGGGFNIGAQILPGQRLFGPEDLWSAEAGVKREAADGRFDFQADVFFMRREHMQVYTSQQLYPTDPLTYVFFTQNASNGQNMGLESAGRFRVDEHWELSGSLALLSTTYTHVAPVFASLDLDGRAQPFAPGYEVSAAAEYHRPSGWFARLDSHAVDSFFYYTSDPQTSHSYHVENLRFGLQRGAWTASLWARNLFDERYAQQGFYFGLIPPNFPVQQFLQLANPRQVGATVSFQFGADSTREQ